jgi:nickel-dependent lactate racemase
MLRALLDELAGVVDDRAVTVLVATGTHRGNTPAELRQMLGDLLDRVEVVNHDARDRDSLTWCGVHGADVPVWLNRRWVEAEVRITTGFVEPHFFAGFSGGPKLVAPGLAGLDTVLVLHDAARIGDPRATWAVCEGNPVHDDVRAIAAATGVTYALDVVLDAQQRVTAAFGGELLAMHAAAREHVRETAMVAVPDRFDVVVTTNSGFPLDQNLYQAVKGMSAAATIVRPGGTIVMAAECRDGFPDHGDFRTELAAEGGPAELLARIAARERTVPDQWQVQVLARVLQSARVGLYTSGLAPADVRAAHLDPIDDVGAYVRALAARFTAEHGRPPAICVLPEGPQTIPYVDGGA